MQLSEREKQQLDDLGYVLLDRFMSDDLRLAVRRRIDELFEEEGDAAGSEFKREPGSRRLANLVDKGEVFRRVLAVPKILAAARHVMGSDVKLSSLNARSADPRTGRTQPLHADVAAIADAQGYWVFNTVWMLDDFTLDNGALRVIPGSHRWRKLPQDELADPVAAHPAEVIVTGSAGDVLLMNAHVWHGGLANRTDAPRLALHVFYCRRDKPQQQNQKELIRATVQKDLCTRLRLLLALDECETAGVENAPGSGFL